ncbi:MAG: hypothetical protein AAF348_17870 [Bacteroidota bacterium]
MDKMVIVDKEVFRKLMAGQRSDIKRGICSKSEVLEILGISAKQYYKEMSSGKSLLEPSKVSGKYTYSSVVREFKRIHGHSYSDATIS